MGKRRLETPALLETPCVSVLGVGEMFGAGLNRIVLISLMALTEKIEVEKLGG